MNFVGILLFYRFITKFFAAIILRSMATNKPIVSIEIHCCLHCLTIFCCMLRCDIADLAAASAARRSSKFGGGGGRQI